MYCECVFPNTLGQPREVKIGLIMLKFGTLIDRMNIPGDVFLFFENRPFWALGTCFSLNF